MTAAATRPMARVSVSTPARLDADAHHVGRATDERARPPWRAPSTSAPCPGVPRLAIQPQPRPDTSDSMPMTATVMRPARTSMRARRAPLGARAGPVPRDVDDADGRRHLDGRRQRAQDDAPDRMARPGRRHAGQQQAHHERVVVRAADEREQGERVEHREHEGGAGVLAEGAGELGDAVGDQRRRPTTDCDAEQHDGDQRVVEAQRGRPARQHQEERPVRGGAC